ncbi:MAG: hypothetical protein IT379_07885 [Deltaproteobacteria bacterium]|nr:hypothetical protein [Deltaproteobacteria bacterium]
MSWRFVRGIAAAGALSAMAISPAACGRGGPQEVVTPNGSFTVPGPARVRGGPGEIGFAVTDEGCEIHLGTPLELTGVRTRAGEASFRFSGSAHCGGSGWISWRHVVRSVPR